MRDRALRVALTGGLATGKSHCLRQFAALGAPVIDADVLAHEALAPGTPGLAAVTERFGRNVLHPGGELNRPALGALVFSDPRSRADLEAIVHPIVYGRIQSWFAGLPADAVGIADVPLLYETGKYRDFDRVVVAVCPPETQIARAVARDKLTREQAALRLAAQMPISEKARLGDYVIDTSGDRADTDAQVAQVWQQLRHELQ